MKFYLGTHQPGWLNTSDVPLFVSHRRLSKYVTLPRARTGWALDSGGFTELSLYGEWRTSAEEYVRAVARYDEEIGKLEWAAPRDRMCEGPILAKTGKTAVQHKHETVEDFVQLCELWPQYSDAENPIMPALQGDPELPVDECIESYLHCIDLYMQAGIRLQDYPVVGVGSVCRRQDTPEIGALFQAIAALDIAPHGFGVAAEGVALYGVHLASADSLAWSYGGRRTPTRCGSIRHKNEANCIDYALAWRQRVVSTVERIGGAA